MDNINLVDWELSPCLVLTYQKEAAAVLPYFGFLFQADEMSFICYHTIFLYFVTVLCEQD